MYISGKYEVSVCEYAETHFLKNFSKKYKTWQKTFDVIENLLSHIDNLLLSSKAEKIHICDTGYIAKCEFKIVGSNKSAKISGNRIIVFVDKERFKVKILLIYSKNHYLGNNETVWWEQEIKNNYDFIKNLFNF